jgi:hypothetical protein
VRIGRQTEAHNEKEEAVRELNSPSPHWRTGFFVYLMRCDAP